MVRGKGYRSFPGLVSLVLELYRVWGKLQELPGELKF